VAEGRRYFISIAVLIAGLLIIYTMAPRVMAYGVMQGGASTISDLGRDKDVLAHDVSHAISGRQASLRWFERGRTHLEIAILYLVLADNPKFSGSLRKSFLTKSIAAFRKGLALEPRKPYAWMQFAQAQFREDRRSEAVKAYMEMSYIVAPQEPLIVVTRVHLGFRALFKTSTATTHILCPEKLCSSMADRYRKRRPCPDSRVLPAISTITTARPVIVI